MRLANTIKDLIMQTVIANGTCDIVTGEVTAVNPLVITLDDKTPIPASNIGLTKNTSEWTMEMSVDHLTENRAGGGGLAEYASHNHEYKGRKRYLVHNQLMVGDIVYLLRESGGQRYIALDRVYNPDRGCTDR